MKTFSAFPLAEQHFSWSPNVVDKVTEDACVTVTKDKFRS